MDFVVVAEVAVVAILPNVASVGIEERVVTPAIRELDAGVGSLRHGGLGLKDWFQRADRPMAKLAHSSVVDCSILTTLRRFPIIRVGSGTPRIGYRIAMYPIPATH